VTRAARSFLSTVRIADRTDLDSPGPYGYLRRRKWQFGGTDLGPLRVDVCKDEAAAVVGEPPAYRKPDGQSSNVLGA
jgi:hypothetical protein